MNNFFVNKLKEEEGAVLITSLLFLMIVTVLSIIGIQSPKTDIMISGNEKLSVQAQQLANLGVMEGKNWLAIRYKPNAVPLNAGDGTDFFIVVRPDPILDTDFSRAGILSSSTVAINFTTADGSTITGDNFNSPDSNSTLGKQISQSDYTLKNDNNKDIGTYEWSITRISQVGTILDPTVKEADISLEMPNPTDSSDIRNKFTSPKPITEGYNAAIGEDKAFWQYFYIKSKGFSNGLVAQSEGIASYKQIVPSSD